MSHKLSVPIKGMTQMNITQTYHDGHKALDIVSFEQWHINRGYGTPLCAPEDCEVLKITGDTYTGDSKNLERGYGIYLKGLETNFVHFYWHVLPIMPVNLGQIIKRGKIVAFMGNAGKVFTHDVYVPIEERLSPQKPGTHLHYELFDETYKIGGEKKPINPLDHLDFTKQPVYSTVDLIGAISNVALKILKLIS